MAFVEKVPADVFAGIVCCIVHDYMFSLLTYFGLFSSLFYSISDYSVHFSCQSVSRLSPDDPCVNS